MGFFDLNVPYHEADRRTTDKSSLKAARLKLIIKAMELGYTGVAYNRTIRGVISDSDRCSTSLFPLSSLLKLSPSLSSSVKFHRDLLKLPLSMPFRQYTRLTVAVDNPAQVSSLNSGNSILKSYDVIAVRPLNQSAFDQACKASEVDLISIDLMDAKLFRLKQPMIKAAIGRGVYFEIGYSGLIIDEGARRQMIRNTKLLVDWTQGKNLIISSASPSVAELRGPYDVANLSLLLGLSMEHAKAALSKNCRSLLANALRRKHFYKEAIRVELISSGPQIDSKEAAFDEWLKWDPISSGEGDLLLDDIAKSFSDSSKVSKPVKAIDFSSMIDNLPSTGLQINDLISVKNPAQEPSDIGKNHSSEQPDKLSSLPANEDWIPLNDSPFKHSLSTWQDLEVPLGPDAIPQGFSPHRIEMQDSHAQDNINLFSHENETVHTFVRDAAVSPVLTAFTTSERSMLEEISQEPMRQSDMDVVMGEENVEKDEVSIERDMKSLEGAEFVPFAVSSNGGFPETEEYRDDKRDGSITLADRFSAVESHNEMRSQHKYMVTHDEQQEKVAAVEEKTRNGGCTPITHPILGESLSGRGRAKQRTTHRTLAFPFKRILSRVSFKRKSRKSRTKLRFTKVSSLSYSC